MSALFGFLLVALAVPALLINLYFVSLILNRWSKLRRGLSTLFHACGADTSSCAIVIATPYARLFAGAPNVLVGTLWCLALLGLAGFWLLTGTTPVPWPFLMVAGASLLVGAYLVHALVVVLKEPCPL